MTVKEVKIKTKIVVRGLPPTLTEDAFKSSIEEFLPHIDYAFLMPGKTTAQYKINASVFLNFKEVSVLNTFAEKFSGHLFVDAKGHEYRAEVEYAPYQKAPKGRRRQDPRKGTIETDPDYLTFLEGLNKPVDPLPSAEVQLEKRLAEERERQLQEGENSNALTPLLADLKAKKLAKAQKAAARPRSPKRDRAERRKRQKERERLKKEKENEKPKRKDRGRRQNRKKRKEKELAEKGQAGQPLQPGDTQQGVGGNPGPQGQQPVQHGGGLGGPGAGPKEPKKSLDNGSLDGGQPPVGRKPRKEREKNNPVPNSNPISNEPVDGGDRRWMAIKKHLEPGSITIQPRPLGKDGTPTEPKQSSLSATAPSFTSYATTAYVAAHQEQLYGQSGQPGFSGQRQILPKQNKQQPPQQGTIPQQYHLQHPQLHQPQQQTFGGPQTQQYQGYQGHAHVYGGQQHHPHLYSHHQQYEPQHQFQTQQFPQQPIQPPTAQQLQQQAQLPNQQQGQGPRNPQNQGGGGRGRGKSGRGKGEPKKVVYAPKVQADPSQQRSPQYYQGM